MKMVVVKLVELNYSKDKDVNNNVIIIGIGILNVYLFIEFVL